MAGDPSDSCAGGHDLDEPAAENGVNGFVVATPAVQLDEDG